MTTPNDSDVALLPPLAGSALLVQKASAGGMTGGRRGGSRIPHRPAMLSVGGLVWTSPLPETHEQADFYNGAADRINSQNSKINEPGSFNQQPNKKQMIDAPPNRKNPDFDPWKYEHSTFTWDMWRDEVINHDTLQGYLDWVEHKIANEDDGLADTRAYGQ